MKRIIASILLMSMSFFGYSQDISIQSGIFKSDVYGRGDFPSEFKDKNGLGMHLGIEYHRILPSTHSNVIYGLECKHFKHDMVMILKDDLDQSFKYRNGTYKTDAVSFLCGVRSFLNSDRKVQLHIDALSFLSWNYNSKFSGEAYKWYGTEIINESTEIIHEPESSIKYYTPLNLGIIIRPSVGVYINETNYISIQGLINANVFGGLIYRYEVIDISMWNYGINIGWTFELKNKYN